VLLPGFSRQNGELKSSPRHVESVRHDASVNERF
jgi:hypothetical protein